MKVVSVVITPPDSATKRVCEIEETKHDPHECVEVCVAYAGWNLEVSYHLLTTVKDQIYGETATRVRLGH